MDALIKRIKDISGNTRFEVFKKGDLIAADVFHFNNKKSEEIAYELALKLAKIIEDNIPEETIVYQTGVQPIDFFMAANMKEEHLSNHLENIKS